MNKKIKIIELLNKTANGEELPKKIKYESVFELQDGLYLSIDDNTCRFADYLWCDFSNINDEVEILEDNTEKQEYLGESWKEVGKRVGEWAKEFEQGFKESFTEIVTCPFKKLEDNTKEIEELDIQSIKEMPFETLDIGWEDVRDTTNDLIKAVKQLDKKIKEKE